MGPRLIVLDALPIPREVVPDEDLLEIGRASDAGLVIPSPSVSRRHAVLRRSADGAILLEDWGSTFGTFVNDVRLPPRSPVALKDGDVIRLGQVRIIYRMEVGAESVEETFRDAEFASRANARLLLLEESGVRRRPIARVSTVIGCAPHCEILLPDANGPPEQALLRASGGRFWVESRCPSTPPLLGEGQRPVGGKEELPSGSVLLLHRSQALFIQDFDGRGQPAEDPLRAVSKRRILRRLAERTGIPPAALRRLTRGLPPDQRIGEALVESRAITPLFWRALAGSLLAGGSRRSRLGCLFHPFRPRGQS